MKIFVVPLEVFMSLKNNSYSYVCDLEIGACDILSACPMGGKYTACSKCPLLKYPRDISNMSIEEEYAFAKEEVILHKALGNIPVNNIEGLDDGY